MHRAPHAAPQSALPPERRGRVVGRFCRSCQSIYPQFSARHAGKPALGRDHLASTCAFEGQPFVDGASFWEPAVEVVDAPAPPAA